MLTTRLQLVPTSICGSIYQLPHYVFVSQCLRSIGILPVPFTCVLTGTNAIFASFKHYLYFIITTCILIWKNWLFLKSFPVVGIWFIFRMVLGITSTSTMSFIACPSVELCHHCCSFFLQSLRSTERVFCKFKIVYTVVPRYTSLIRSRSLDLYQTGHIPNEFFP
jgi:hypothetical protein